MTHTKKKFVSKTQVDFSFDELEKSPKSAVKLKFEEFDQVFSQTEDNQIIMGFLYMHNGKPIIIHEPDPCILYFTSAEKSLAEITSLQKQILDSAGLNNTHKIAELFFTFYQLSSNYVINLFAAIEAFNNSVLPDDYTFRLKKKLYDKTSIQRFLKHDLKTKQIIPEIFGKSFPEEFPNNSEIISKMKQLRDNAIHMKNYDKSFAASYRELFREFIAFDFINSYSSTKQYVNYYKSNWIEDCNCEKY